MPRLKLSPICLVSFAVLARIARYAGGMKDTRWLNGMHHLDTIAPPAAMTDEPVYTLFMRDFLTMPDVDFGAVTAVDQAVRSLLN